MTNQQPPLGIQEENLREPTQNHGAQVQNLGKDVQNLGRDVQNLGFLYSKQ